MRIFSKAVVALAIFGVAGLGVGLGSGTAQALPPGGPIIKCAPGYVPGDDGCVPVTKAPPTTPPPATPSKPVNPFGDLNTATQTTARNAVRITGWAADPDAPTTPLTVQIIVDGAPVQTTVANASRTDVAAAYPGYGAAHGYDITVPATSAGHTVCATAFNIGAGTNTSLKCVSMDQITSFAASTISYDMSKSTLQLQNVQAVANVPARNATTVPQNVTVGATNIVTDVTGWSDSSGLTETVSNTTSASVLGLIGDDLTLGAESTTTYVQNGSTSYANQFTWSTTVQVPANSIVTAVATVAHYKLSVPFTLTGALVYRSGLQAPGQISGVYSGVASTDLQVSFVQTNLDGSPAAAPLRQQAVVSLTRTPAPVTS